MEVVSNLLFMLFEKAGLSFLEKYYFQPCTQIKLYIPINHKIFESRCIAKCDIFNERFHSFMSNKNHNTQVKQ
jgi:hypothetical protein